MHQLTVAEAVFDVSEDDAYATAAVDLRNFRLMAVEIPAAWDEAASIGFLSTARSGPRNYPPAFAEFDLAFALDIAGTGYRVLTGAEQAMARGLSWVWVASLDPADLTDTIVQGADSELLLVVEPRD